MLVADYQKNEVMADDKYKGKRLRVVGILDSITKDIADNMLLSLKAQGSLLGVMATMQDGEENRRNRCALEGSGGRR